VSATDRRDEEREEAVLAFPVAAPPPGAPLGTADSAQPLALPSGRGAHGARDSYAALRSHDFRLYLVGRFLSALGDQMLVVAVGWELYQRTNSALALGFVGLVQIIPVLLLSLPAGHVADRLNRKGVVLCGELLLIVAVLGLGALSFMEGPLSVFYGCLLLLGIGTAVKNPANTALLSQTVPEESYVNAATWSSSSWQLAAVLGPALGGLVIALAGAATPVYALDAVAAVIFVVLTMPIRLRPMARRAEGRTLRSLAEGVGFVWRTKVILAAITLDLFAVLLGGATTLLPIYARDILYVGPVGLGWLDAAPSMGAVTMALLLAHLPPFRRTGWALLVAVAGFGVATVVFGLSTSFALSLAMLVLLGALDNISVVTRSTLLLVRTPDELRGRIAAVNSVFVNASNQLGGFESGLVAALFTPVIAVVGGGAGTVVVVTAVALIFPQLRRLRRLAPG
jgi:MFS family permease